MSVKEPMRPFRVAETLSIATYPADPSTAVCVVHISPLLVPARSPENVFASDILADAIPLSSSAAGVTLTSNVPLAFRPVSILASVPSACTSRATPSAAVVVIMSSSLPGMLAFVLMRGLKKRDRVRIKHEGPIGVLHLRRPATVDGVTRYWPSDDLDPFVEHYWSVRWDLEAPRIVETVPVPSVHMVLEAGESRIYGVMHARFSRRLSGRVRVLGTRFWPGAF